MVGLIQLISTMTHQPPVDQRIVDEYFQLISHRKTKDVAWLYAMVATYGLKPEELEGFTWAHPQWAFLFELKEKQPCELQSCWSSLCSSLYRAIAYQDIRSGLSCLNSKKNSPANCRAVGRPSVRPSTEPLLIRMSR
jgi:hypothetical protein